MALTINGEPFDEPYDTRTSLLELVRGHAHLTGTKRGCDQGGCGACTVLVDGERVLSCLTLAVQAEGHEVTTIEGVGGGTAPHPLQRAFVEHDGFQCGYCTPGQICSAIGMAREIERGVPSVVTPDLASQPSLTPEEIRERMSGNLCRCGAHNGIVHAVHETFAEEAAR
jgi:xanthine dehydrogenase YagT iron-sulfur-binding subunit